MVYFAASGAMKSLALTTKIIVFALGRYSEIFLESLLLPGMSIIVRLHVLVAPCVTQRVCKFTPSDGKVLLISLAEHLLIN